MKKATALALAGLMVASAANASMSRKNAFGESAKFVKDVQNVWTLPEETADDADSTYFEIGNIGAAGGVAASTGYQNLAVAANAWGGNHMKLGGGVFGLWYNRPFQKNNKILTGSFTAGALTSPITDPAVTLGFAPGVFNTPQNQVDALYAFSAGSAEVGVGITYATNNQRTENNTNAGTAATSSSANDFGISLGVGFKDMGALKTLDAGLQFDMPSAQQTSKNATGTVDDKITKSGTEIDLRVNADMGDKNSGNIVDLGVMMQNSGVKAEPKTAPAANAYTESKASYMDVNLGWAMSMSSDKGMGLGGFILDWNTASSDQMNRITAQQADKVDISVLGIKGVSGGEAKVKEWLTLRMALSGTLFYSKSTTIDQSSPGTTLKSTVTTSVPAAPAAITVGTSLNVGQIVIDGVANQDMFFTGPYLISGVPNGLSTQVSATWGWGGSKE